MISAILGAGAVSLILTKAAKAAPKLKEFAFPISMLAGMFGS